MLLFLRGLTGILVNKNRKLLVPKVVPTAGDTEAEGMAPGHGNNESRKSHPKGSGGPLWVQSPILEIQFVQQTFIGTPPTCQVLCLALVIRR